MKKQNPPRTKLLLSAAMLTIASFLPALVPSGNAYADQIGARSLTLLPTSTDPYIGGSQPSDPFDTDVGIANHQFQINLPSADAVDAIHFEYCTTASAVPGGIDCDAPENLDASTADLGADGGTGWSITNQTANTVTVSGASIGNPGLQGAKTFQLDDVTNPDGSDCTDTEPNCTFFVRITTYDGGTSGTEIDSGTVAAATALQIELSGDMPESLVFCVGREVTETNNVPDCSSITTGAVSFNQLFTPEGASWATSQMAASTNAGSGYAITVNGATMTSGGNTIAAIGGTSTTSAPGTSQFGLNVVENDEPNDGLDNGPAVSPLSANVTEPTGNSLHAGQAVGAYSTGGDDATAEFAFATGNTVANSAGGASDSQVFTVTYLVNVPGSQPAGTYVTTLTYIATASF